MLAFFLLAILPLEFSAGILGIFILTGNFRVVAFVFLALQAISYMFRLIRFLGGRFD